MRCSGNILKGWKGNDTAGIGGIPDAAAKMAAEEIQKCDTAFVYTEKKP